MAKLNVSQKVRDFIKLNYDELDPDTLPKQERRYYNLVKAGKVRAESAPRVKGRYLGGKVLELVEQVAERKGVTVADYLADHSEEVADMVNNGYIKHEGKRSDSVVELLEATRRKYIEVETQHGVQRIPKLEAIEALKLFEQYSASNTTIVQLGVPVRVYESGKIRITIVDVRGIEKEAKESEEGETDYFLRMLDDNDVFYIDSPAKGKGK